MAARLPDRAEPSSPLGDLDIVQCFAHICEPGDAIMDVVTYSEARKNFKAVMDRVVDDSDYTVITRQRGEPVVIVSMSEWNSIQETAHLLSSPRNAERLRASIAELEAGQVTKQELLGEDERRDAAE
jgi:antitoxin YefM